MDSGSSPRLPDRQAEWQGEDGTTKIGGRTALTKRNDPKFYNDEHFLFLQGFGDDVV